jgi:tetratricopeptide (TPR) repeat protein
MAGRDDRESLPLSFAADRIINALSRRLEGTLDARHWLLALLEERPGLLTEADPAADIEALAIKARSRAGEATDLLEVSELGQRASKHAIAAGREVVAPVDVAYAILAAQARASAASGPMKAEPKTAKPSSSATPRGKKSAASKADQEDEEITFARFEPPPSSQPRVIRVFVSSTFRDMQEEREELVKRVFPQLRKLCETRGVTWGEVDLRWGVSDEQKAEGKVLPICLAEIQRCRPYFIGLLGERYGWVPDEIDPGLIQQEPWLSERLGKSVTELEVLHGVLNNPKMEGHAFFYLRDPSYVADRAPGQFLEQATAKEIAELSPEEAERCVEARRVSLRVLKKRIRESGFPVRENYSDPRALGESVLADLSAVIERVYPAGLEPDPLDREIAEHEAFARSRTGVYIGRSKYTERLGAHTEGDEQPLVVLGESGLGKSALLANWALAHREKHPGELVILHFIGASPSSSDWRAMLKRIIGQLARHFSLELEIPDQPDQLRLAFVRALHAAAARGKVVLVLDALNQLEDREGAPDLLWLPAAVPSNIRLIVSTLPGRPLDELTKRGWPTLTIEPLQPAQRKRLIADYLAQYTKTLDSARSSRIADAPQSANPLFLKTLLEELRLWGEHETLDQAIGGYLEAGDPADLYAKILERYEADYERERPRLVRDAMTLIWAARDGLGESELLDLLGSKGEPLARAHWSPLFLAAEQGFASRNGLLAFGHDYLRQAIELRYLRAEQEKHNAHLRLADYFASRELGPRKITELPWQLGQAGAWQRLFELLSQLDFLEAAWERDGIGVKRSWAEVERNSPLRLVDAYGPLLEDPKRYADHVSTIAQLLRDTGHPEQSLSLQQFLTALYRKTGDRANLQSSLGNQALILYDRGDLDKAMALFAEVEKMSRQLHDLASLQSTLGNQAVILKDRGDLDRAMALFKEVEQISRQVGDLGRLQRTLGNQALILKTRGDLEGALALLKEAEQMSRQLGDPVVLGHTLLNQATILHDRGDPEGAMALLKEAEQICREFGDPDGLQHTLGDQAVILHDRGDLAGAMALFKEAEKICRELGDRASLQRSLGSQAVIFDTYGQPDRAMTLYKEQERICRQLGDRASLQRSLGNQSGTLQKRGDLKGAMALLQEQQRICQELGHVDGLALALANQAVLLRQMGRVSEAASLAQDAYRLAGEHGLIALAQRLQPLVDSFR